MKEHKISKVPSSLNEDLQVYVATPSQHGSPVNFQSTSVDWDHLLCAQGPQGGPKASVDGSSYNVWTGPEHRESPVRAHPGGARKKRTRPSGASKKGVSNPSASDEICATMKQHKISRVPASLNEHLHVSRARTLEGGWGGRVLRTSPEQNSENLSPSSESERCESFLDFDVKGLA